MAGNNRTQQVLVSIGAAVEQSFDRSIGRATNRLNDLGRTQQRLAQIQEQKSALRGQMMDAAGLVASLGSVVVAASRFEDTMVDVGKQTGLTGDKLDDMGLAIRAVARDSPKAAGEIATIMAEAGKAGVASDDLMGFARSAEKIAIAWEMPAEKVGSTLATWRTSFGMSAERADQLADRINYLGDNLNTTPAKVAGVVTRLGQMARSAGLSEDEFAALTATMNASGTPIDQTRTAMKNLIARMQAGESATKAQQEAFAALGFDAKTMARAMQDDAQGAIMNVLAAIRDAPKERQGSLVKQLFGMESLAGIQGLVGNLDTAEKMIADVTQTEKAAGTVAQEYARKMETMSAQARILWGRITDLGITIGNQLLPTLKVGAQAIGSVVSGVVRLAESMPVLTSVVTHAAGGLIAFKVASLGARYASLLMQGSMLSAHLGVGRLVQGLMGVPVQTDAAAYGMNRAGRAARWLGGALVSMAARVPGVRGALAGIGMQAALMGQTLSQTPGVIGKARVAIFAFAGAFRVLGAAIMTTPIGWIAGGIALVGAAIYKWWEPLTNWLGGFWDGLSSTFGRVGAAVQRAYEAMGPLKPMIDAALAPTRLLWTAISGIGRAAGWLVGQIGSLLSPVEQTGQEAKDTAEAGARLGQVIGDVLVGAVRLATRPLRRLGDLIGWISDVAAPGRALIETFAGGIGEAASYLYDKVAGVLQTVRDYLPFSDARRGPLSNLTASGRALIGTLAEGVGSAASWLTSKVGAVVGGAANMADRAWGGVRDLAIRVRDSNVGQAVARVRDQAGAAASFVKSTVGDMAARLATGDVTGAIGVLTTRSEAAADAIRANVTRGLGHLRDTAGQAVEGVTSRLSRITGYDLTLQSEDVTGALDAIGRTARNTASEVAGTVGDMAARLSTGDASGALDVLRKRTVQAGRTISSALGIEAEINAETAGRAVLLLRDKAGDAASFVGSTLGDMAARLATGDVTGALGVMRQRTTEAGRAIADALGFSADVDTRALIDGLTGVVAPARDIAGRIGSAVGAAVARIPDRVREVIGSIPDVIASMGDQLKKAGSAIIGTVVDGISANASAIKDKMSSVLSGVRDYLPFSDAKRGPLSELTRSGRAIPDTIARGIDANERALVQAANRMAGAAAGSIRPTAEVTLRPRMAGLSGLPGVDGPDRPSSPQADAQAAVHRAAAPGGAPAPSMPAVGGHIAGTPASGGGDSYTTRNERRSVTINAPITVQASGGDPDEIARRVRAEIEAIADDTAFARRSAFND